MKKDRFNQLVRHPESISKADIPELQELLETYPYFHQPRFLIALYHFLEKDQETSARLQSVAIHTYDRGHLKTRFEEIQEIKKVAQEQEAHKKAQAAQSNREEKTSRPSTSTATREDVVQDIKIKFPVERAMPDHLDDAFFKELEENLTMLQQNKLRFSEHYQEDEKEKPKRKATPKKKRTTTSKKASSESSSKPKKTKAKSTTAKKSSAKSKTASAKPKTTKKTSDKKSGPKKKANVEAIDFLQEIEKKESKDVTDKRKKEQLDVITRFIEKEPELSRQSKSDPKKQDKEDQTDLAERSTSLNDDLISENLAKILIKQGKKEKAIDIYKKLIWKFPQKKAYFATQIENLKSE